MRETLVKSKADAEGGADFINEKKGRMFVLGVGGEIMWL